MNQVKEASKEKDFENLKKKSNRLGRRLFGQINTHRLLKKLPQLNYSDILSDIAFKHSLDMAENKVFVDHNGIEERVKLIPFYITKYIENVGVSKFSENPTKDILKQWK